MLVVMLIEMTQGCEHRNTPVCLPCHSLDVVLVSLGDGVLVATAVDVKVDCRNDTRR